MDHEQGRAPLYEITQDSQNLRLDIFLAGSLTDLSRSRIQSLIKDGFVKVNNLPSKPGCRLKAGDHVSLTIPPAEAVSLEPEAVDFEILYEDESLIVVNKPPGVVVHPAPGHPTGTLVHGLLKHCKDLSGIGGVLRPGIVHRLDKDTSGLMVVAKNDRAHNILSRQFKSGKVQKEYAALVHGLVEGDEQVIDLPISRHPQKRKEMAVSASGGKRAITHWKKIKEFRSGFSLLSVSIKTGRTHQIRVHLSYIGHPVVGDPVYGYGQRWWKNSSNFRYDMPVTINRQLLHARRLGFTHPDRGDIVEYESPLPKDMNHILTILSMLDLQGKSPFGSGQ
ncbi:Uncharacterized RNA pseudouridine synthase YlyB [uncultured Desulfobacterium sp.]|uniref:Pseudouridine synthase n=1 Tax=uncultured Desulfobacterium sp. TaxID=201089 RepID=A0A445MUV2_9BACT|nr:Uncharacterized RNA pseudouridine synthase YlyB [uncultured Desulfobacterium sp.]